MDTNKLSVLQEVGYRIPETCATCEHSDLSADGWGYCNLHKYQHLKHTEDTSRLSVNKAGVCQSYNRDDKKVATANLGAFIQFVYDTP